MVITPNKGLLEPARGAINWDIPLNSNFTIMDTAFGDSLEIDVTGITTTQTLTVFDYQNFAIVFTGTLSANLIYQIPSGVGGQWLFGSTAYSTYTITIQNAASGSATITVPSGYIVSVCSDGSSVYPFGSTIIFGTRGVFGGGYTNPIGGFDSAVMDYITIATTGNATTFGNLTVARWYLAGVNSETRGVFGGGWSATTAVMDYITIATTGNATTFGNLTLARYGLAGVSSSTRGVFGGGVTGSTWSAVMDYITIATTGNATTFGNLTVARYGLAGVSSGTRGVFGGGVIVGNTKSAVMDYITIATTGNATTFGNLTVARNFLAGVSSSTRGVFGGGTATPSSVVMNYITIATTGNATTFGNLTSDINSLAGVSSGTRGVFGGGVNGATPLSTMEYITIATTGNTTSFGNLTVTRYGLAGVSSYVPS